MRDTTVGGALINEGIHQIDLLLYLAGAVKQVFGFWQLGEVHPIEGDDTLSAVIRYESGATGVIQASTATWPGYPERIEIHGTKGTAIVTGDKLTTGDVKGDFGAEPPLEAVVASGASDPMAISTLPFEPLMLDFAESCKTGRPSTCSAAEGYHALQLVIAIYDSCASGNSISINHYNA